MALPSEEIKEKLDIVEFLKGYLELRPAGKNFKALCPFHGEKTPSFIISPERQMWHCFGCGEGGDIFKFLMKQENLEFYEALKVLAEKAGIELKRISPADQKQFGVLYDINNVATEFFRNTLAVSNKGKAYVKERGLKDETISEFEIGFAPNGFDELTLYLINKGFDIDDIARSGVTFRSDKGKYMDRFRGRVMFPIHNNFGKVVGFSGRILPEFDTGESGKYVNSPETPIFNKSKLLYGYYKTKNFINDSRTVLLVEGQMDFLMSYQDGVKNVVATSGTALSLDHLRTLKRVADRIVIGFDNDEAGLLAAERNIDLASANDFDVAILPFGETSEWKDPAELVEKSPGMLSELILNARKAMEHYFKRHLKAENNDRHAIRTVLTKIRNIWSPIEKAHWIKELSHLTNISEKNLTDEMEKIGDPLTERTSGIVETAEKRKMTRIELICERLLSLISLKESFKESVKEHLSFMPANYKLVYHAVAGGERATPQIQEIVNIVSLQDFEMLPEDEERISIEFQELIKELKLEYLNKEREEMMRRILESGENSKDEALKEFQDISTKIQLIKDGKEN